ncbi:MAG: nuclear transport factor 2 family protein [Pseudomonadota bacterium]
MSDLDTSRRACLDRLFEAFNRHDGAGVLACMTEDVVFDAAGGPEMVGRRFRGAAEVRAAFERTFADMPDASWECTRHTVFDDRALSEWIFRATTATGARIEAEGVDLFLFQGDRIRSKSAFRKDRPPLPAATAGSAS